MRERLLLLHGFTQSGASWDPVVRALDGRYTAVAPDLPGHGSMALRQPVSLAACIASVRAHSREHPFALAGYSMGGRIALHVAFALPALVSRLVLVSASPGLADDEERRRRRAADDALADRIEEIGVERFAAEWGAMPLFAGMPPGAATAAHRERTKQRAEGLAASLRMVGTGALPSLWDRLGDLRIPVTVVAGERDEKFTAIADRMGAAIPGARVVIVPGAGHAVHLEAPGAVAAAIG
jgi:2-succinyl-6-hydroxy-2,4-cyclohexadiene-1-carboxylate synthase